MDVTPYLLYLTSRVRFDDLYPSSMEPPKSPKFNITLWQPWVAEIQEASNGASGAGAGAVGPAGAAGSAAPGPEDATAPRQPPNKWRRERRSATRVPDYKNRETGLAASNNKALRSQSFNDKSLSRVAAPRVRAPGAGAAPPALRRSEGDLSRCSDSSEPETDKPDTPTRKTIPFSALKAVHTCKPPEYTESPLDMSVKIRSSPPSYSQSISAGLLYRPSVITQAPTNGGSPASAPAAPAPASVSPPAGGRGEYVPGSMSMCDPVIDEHFRRSLGADYMSLFNKTKENAANSVTNGKGPKVATKDRGSSPIMFASDPCSKFLNSGVKSPISPKSPKSPISPKSPTSPKESIEADNPEPVPEKDCDMEVDDCAGLSVDDHFTRALGDTWKILQEMKPGNIKTARF